MLFKNEAFRDKAQPEQYTCTVVARGQCNCANLLLSSLLLTITS